MLELPPFYVERNKTKSNNQGHTLKHWCYVLGSPGFTRQEENEVLRGDSHTGKETCKESRPGWWCSFAIGN